MVKVEDLCTKFAEQGPQKRLGKASLVISVMGQYSTQVVPQQMMLVMKQHWISI